MSPIRLTYRSKHEREYARIVRSAIYGLWRGYIEQFDFIDQMVVAIDMRIDIAWMEGAASCGIAREELTLEELTALRDFKAAQYVYLVDFAATIEQGSKANRGKFGALLPRGLLWANRYGEARNLAKQMACKDQKLKWVMNPIKEHCGSCLILNGRIYRASVWKNYDLRPRMRRLECGGWACGCDFINTTEPVTPGFPPSI